MIQPQAALASGSVFQGRYEVVRCIQSGGMGTVYEVLDRKTRRRRALKVLLPAIVNDADFRVRFQREATVTADIDSEHVIEIFDADVDLDTGAPFLVMELLKGDDLGRVLDKRGACSPAEAAVLLRQLALALDRTHAAGVVHRDLKPENLFLTRGDDGSPRLKILDFGIAKVVEIRGDAHRTRALGTPLYMAPEQIRGDGSIGPRADLFALGHIAYALLSGEAYWTEDAEQTPGLFALFSRILLGPKERPALRAMRRKGLVLPSALDGWFLRATAVDPEHRFASATAMVEALSVLLGVTSDPKVDIAGLMAHASQLHSANVTPLGAEEHSHVSGPQATAVLDGAGSLSDSSLLPAARTTTPVLNEPARPTGAAAHRRSRPIAVAAMVGAGLVGTSVVLLRQAHSPVGAAAPLFHATSALPDAMAPARTVGRSEEPDVEPVVTPKEAPVGSAVAPESAAPSARASVGPSYKARPKSTVPSASARAVSPPAGGGLSKVYDPTNTRQ